MCSFKKRVFTIIEKGKEGDKSSLIFDWSIIILILLNILALVIESDKNLSINLRYFLKCFEAISIIVFSIEYLLRLWTSDLKMGKSTKIKSMIAYIKSPMALIDLLAIFPFYLPMLIPFDLRALRILRTVRILRLFKVNRYSAALKTLGKVIQKSKAELITTLFLTLLMLFISGVLMYYVEGTAQPKSFPNILSSLWWALSTLTTVGYGDVYPITDFGKLLAGFISLLGIGVVALPTGIISSGFMDEINNAKKDSKCPHCGKKIDG